MSKEKARRDRLRRLSEARLELSELRSCIDAAYSVFNSTSDPELIEASILEISALRSKYDRKLRDMKNLGEA